MRNDKVKLLLGIAIGTAIGAAIAYLSDDERRGRLIDGVNDATDKVRENIKDAYYETRIRGRKAKRDLARYMADMRGEAEGFYEDVKERAARLARRSEEKCEELADKIEEKYDEIEKKF
ncbi:YtxH domain-containing protein [Porphyromonas sp.]|uniref:YtxH domain-containing protein n=1 Tax=Porphyromonas sp. TaxID=1924944 RepID=UPI0026DAC2AA|nr:YtxH domain-containing protein [Porphyromonas sp.]MDO4695805.1 YtxH domain-containing protein [Porphyromonas sp.]MDO4771789.1 YtxH domain-containing protein [Porphyromonas sp.]